MDTKKGWGDAISWAVIAVAIIHTGLLYTIHDLSSVRTAIITIIQPMSAIGVCAVFMMVAYQHTGKWRLIWMIQSFSVISSILGLCIQVGLRLYGVSTVTTLTDILYLATYSLSLLALLIALPRTASVGGVWLAITDGLLIGAAVAVGIDALIPSLPWNNTESFLSFDVTILFALLVVMARIGHNGGPLVVLSFYSIICLFIADIGYTISITAIGPDWLFLAGPLYTLHRILLALGAYWSLKHPPSMPVVAPLDQPSTFLMWILAPQITMILALVIAIHQQTPISSLWPLFLMGIAQMVCAVQDVRRILREMHQRAAAASLDAIKTLLRNRIEL